MNNAPALMAAFGLLVAACGDAPLKNVCAAFEAGDIGSAAAVGDPALDKAVHHLTDGSVAEQRAAYELLEMAIEERGLEASCAALLAEAERWRNRDWGAVAVAPDVEVPKCAGCGPLRIGIQIRVTPRSQVTVGERNVFHLEADGHVHKAHMVTGMVNPLIIEPLLTALDKAIAATPDKPVVVLAPGELPFRTVAMMFKTAWRAGAKEVLAVVEDARGRLGSVPVCRPKAGVALTGGWGAAFTKLKGPGVPDCVRAAPL